MIKIHALIGNVCIPSFNPNGLLDRGNRVIKQRNAVES